MHACPRHLDGVKSQLDSPNAVELALWFHDAIYWPWLPRNEEKSAEWAVRFMHNIQLDAKLCQQVASHILDTRHQATPGAGDAQWLVDIGLAVLGQGQEVYRQFEKNVRSEHRWVRWPRYIAGRSAILQSFLDRPRIYATDWFFEQYEVKAKLNLRKAIASLKKKPAGTFGF